MSTTTDIDVEELRASAVALATEVMDQLEDPRVQLAALQQLFQRIHTGELEHGIPWQEAHQAVRTGRLSETFDVCVWLLDISSLTDMIAES